MDICFLAPRPGGTFADATAALDAAPAPATALTEGQIALWDRLERRIRVLAPAIRTAGGDSMRELDDPATGMQLSFRPPRLLLTAPGSVDLLRQVAAAVEHETGLTAFDTATGAPLSAVRASVPARPETSVIPADAVVPYAAPPPADPSTSRNPRRSGRSRRDAPPADAGPSTREPSSLVLKVMLLSYIPAGAVLFTPLRLPGALAVVVLARVGLRLYWRSRPH
ncbi:MAG: hypothetical protein JWO37_1077 [Acidimicrobiales bacterium]|jgi:hypothetical protein|nr:hypothetical protein [Acidimicrobiales bacterium]